MYISTLANTKHEVHEYRQALSYLILMNFLSVFCQWFKYLCLSIQSIKLSALIVANYKIAVIKSSTLMEIMSRNFVNLSILFNSFKYFFFSWYYYRILVPLNSSLSLNKQIFSFFFKIYRLFVDKYIFIFHINIYSFQFILFFRFKFHI